MQLRALLIKITLQVPHGLEAAPRPVLHTSGGIHQAQSLIISEITAAALATLTAEPTNAQLADFNYFFFHGNCCTCQSQVVMQVV